MHIPYQTMVLLSQHVERERRAEAEAYWLARSARKKSGRSLWRWRRQRRARAAVTPPESA
jgi:hypothetical protein